MAGSERIQQGRWLWGSSAREDSQLSLCGSCLKRLATGEPEATLKNFVLLRIGGEAPLLSTQEGPGGGKSIESVVPLLYHLPQNSKNKKEKQTHLLRKVAPNHSIWRRKVYWGKINELTHQRNIKPMCLQSDTLIRETQLPPAPRPPESLDSWMEGTTETEVRWRSLKRRCWLIPFTHCW